VIGAPTRSGRYRLCAELVQIRAGLPKSLPFEPIEVEVEVSGIAENRGDALERLAIEASHVTDLDVAVATQIQQAMGDLVERSPWVTIGGIRVTSLVLGSDGLSWIYVHGRIRPQQEGLKPTRAAVAIIKSNATECRFSILGHVLLLAGPAGQGHHHQPDHVHWRSLPIRKCGAR
jgi:hypothetical protein